MKEFLRHQILSWRSLFCAIRDLGRSYPWIAIAVIIAASTITAYVQIGAARAERDHLAQQLYAVEQQLAQRPDGATHP